MGIARRKPTTDPEKTTEERLAAARAELARIEGAITDAARDRDLALLDDEPDAVRQAETAAAALEKDKERAGRRVVLLTEKAQADLRERQEKAQADLIERSADHFRERDAATAEMLEHMEGMVAAFHKALKAGNAAISGWPFAFGDTRAALIGSSFVQAIRGELYRLSGDDLGRSVEFPGAHCPDIRDPRTTSVKPMLNKVAEATAYALRVMSAAPIRLLPIAAPPAPPPQTIASATFPESPAPIPAEQPATPKEDRAIEFAWLFDLIETATGKRSTERIVFTKEQAGECHLDGLGPTGPRGREMAQRLAAAGTPEGYQVEAQSLRFDMAALARSIDDN
jgi:hypothetical protein